LTELLTEINESAAGVTDVSGKPMASDPVEIRELHAAV
jgi:hypothetical protein